MRRMGKRGPDDGTMTTGECCDHAAAYGIDMTTARVRGLVLSGAVRGTRGTRWRVDRLSWLAWVNQNRPEERAERPDFGHRTLVRG